MRLPVHPDALNDLGTLAHAAPGIAARLLALLQTVRLDSQLLDLLTVHDYGANERDIFHVSRWQEFWRDGKDLWRLKFWELEHQGHKYRIVYALKRGTGDHQVLGILQRDFNYDAKHPTTRRILLAYEEL